MSASQRPSARRPAPSAPERTGATRIAPVVLRRPLAPADRRTAAGIGAAVAAGAGLAAFYLATLWLARTPYDVGARGDGGASGATRRPTGRRPA